LKRVLTLLVIVGIAAACAAWYFGRSTAQASTLRTAAIRRDDLVSSISATGTVEPEELIDIGAQVAGRILKFGTDSNGKSIDYGSHVEQGMLLAEIDRSIYEADMAQAQATMAAAQAGVKRAEADLQQSKAKLFQAERDWKRAEALGPSDALAQASYDAYRSAYDVAQANVSVGDAAVTQAKAEVDQADGTIKRVQRNLDYTTIASPVKGVVIDRRVNIGQTVVSSLNAPSLFLIATDLSHMQVWVAVNEADVGKIHPGQPVTFIVDAFPGETFRGQVNKVRLNAAMTQNVVTYTVEVETDNSSGKLLPYLTANVKFEVDRHDDVLVVPNPALRWQPRAEQVAPEARAAFEAQQGAASGGAPGGPSSGPSTAASGGAGNTEARRARRQGGGGGPGGPGGATTGPTTRRARGEGPRPGTVWVKEGTFVKPVKVMAGATDDIDTEVRSEELKEGMEVVVGEVVPDANASAGSTNPFAPQPMRRGPGGGGGGRPGGGGGGGARGGGGR
jgi:HlyD family secretion protein